MLAVVHIDGEFNVEPLSNGMIMRYNNEAELAFTLEIGGYRSLRKKLFYSFTDFGGDPQRIVDVIFNQKQFYQRLDLFSECPYSVSQITQVQVVWDVNNKFLAWLFKNVDPGNLIEQFNK